ncbi:MAG: glycerol-3-phosphate 1-O-acyltransferase PlsY [Magnetococcales bacterium]|nr:glycerol-3-phosphate 1-O-acyltransferase PlsY [Magnetococcales bacterium]
METTTLAFVVGAYLLGSVPFGLLVTLASGAGDIRTRGSGNIGATNVLRTAGRLPGALALVLDMAKGGLPVWMALEMLGEGAPGVAATAAAAFLGHLYPIFLKFRGGKGVATALGVFLAWTPLAGLGAALIWLAAARISRISSVGALAAFAGLPLLLAAQGQGHPLAMAVGIALLIFHRHRDNIRRIRAGTEPRIGQKPPPAPHG